MRIIDWDAFRQIKIEDACTACGVPFAQTRSGMVKCPNPDHEDRNPSCRIYGTRYYCFSCQDHGDALDFVSKSIGVGPHEAAEMLWEALGRPESLIRDEEDKRKKGKLWLTGKQMKILGLKPCYKVRCIKGMSNTKPDGPYKVIENDGDFVYLVMEEKTVRTFSIEPELLLCIVESAMQRKMQQIMKNCVSMSQESIDLIFCELEKIGKKISEQKQVLSA